MSGRIQIDARTLDRTSGCDLVGEALGLLETGESLHLTLDHPPDCVHQAARKSRPEETFDLKLVGREEETWKVRVRRFAHPCRCSEGRSL